MNLDTRLFAPDAPGGNAVQPALAASLRSRPAPEGASDRILWPASFFGLDGVALYRDASPADREAILRGCNDGVLTELYYIEKSGMYFASKMALLAESVPERMLYSMFAADEAAHFHWIRAYTPASAIADGPGNPFLRLLDELLRTEDAATLCYLVQVVLEGWGIHHYHALAKASLDADLTATLEAVIRDEGRHHAGGLASFNARSCDAKTMRRLTELLVAFFRMVQVGPQMIVSRIERVRGGLSSARRIRVFEELDCEAGTERRIQTLAGLIRTAARADEVLAALARADALRPCTAAECAAGLLRG